MKIFISYAHVDEYRVRELVDILRDSEFEPWFDQRLVVGRAWEEQILAAIQDCERFLYALTPESVQSRWCQWEFAQALHAGKPIIPVLVQKMDTLPGALAGIQYADFSNGPQPRAVARLIAGVMGAKVISPDGVPLLPAPHDKPERPVETAKSSRKLGDQLYEDAYSLFRQKQYAEAWELLHDCLLIDENHAEAQKLRAFVERRLPPVPVTDILPPPFEWVEIPAGKVPLEDYRKHNGTAGGEYKVPGFWMAKYPITNAQYQVFVEQGYGDPRWWDYSEAVRTWRNKQEDIPKTAFEGDKLPRTNVCWYEAVAFCLWLSEQTRLNITLPTEQQWQRAAQGDDGREYPWGNGFDAKRCNVDTRRPTPVTQYPNGASPFGVMDMSGNVCEWCLTTWGDDSISLDEGARRVLRGGSWYVHQIYARCAYRIYGNPVGRLFDIGFRVVCASPI